MWRVGIGLDHHRLLTGRSPAGFFLTLGGYEIPASNLSCDANSDGDVIIHALCNALSTALGGGSLSLVSDSLCAAGQKESYHYLAYYQKMLVDQKYQINNLSISVEAAQPKLEPHRKKIGAKLASLLRIDPSLIGLAFTTGEGLTACGQGEGISAQVLVSLTQVC